MRYTHARARRMERIKRELGVRENDREKGLDDVLKRHKHARQDVEKAATLFANALMSPQRTYVTPLGNGRLERITYARRVLVLLQNSLTVSTQGSAATVILSFSIGNDAGRSAWTWRTSQWCGKTK